MNQKALDRISRANAKRYAVAQFAKTNVAKLSEADIERTCTEYLAWDGWRALKTDPVSRREWGKGFGELGMADHLYIRYSTDIVVDVTQHSKPRAFPAAAELLWIEWKRKGGKAQARQSTWHTLERKRGALTLIAGQDFEATIDGFKAWYEASGLKRK